MRNYIEKYRTETKVCECGCGEEMRAFDDRGRPKKFINGHQHKRHIGIKRPEVSLKMKELIDNGKWHPPIMKGKDHPNWKGGISKGRKGITNRKFKLWKANVHKLDKFTCQMCGTKPTGKNLIAHHIRDWNKYPKLRYIVSNGLTVCRSCHKKIHKEIGLKTRF